MLVIGVIGTKGSGKDTLAGHIAKKYHGGHHAHSEIYREILEVLHMPNSRINLIKLVELRKVFGENVLVHALNKKLLEEKRDLQVVTGIRFANELENIRSFDHNIVLYVDAPIELRYERHMHRKQSAQDEDVSFADFVKTEDLETERHIVELGKQADYRIENAGSLGEFLKQADDIVGKVIEKGL